MKLPNKAASALKNIKKRCSEMNTFFITYVLRDDRTEATRKALT